MASTGLRPTPSAPILLIPASDREVRRDGLEASTRTGTLGLNRVRARCEGAPRLVLRHLRTSGPSASASSLPEHRVKGPDAPPRPLQESSRSRVCSSTPTWRDPGRKAARCFGPAPPPCSPIWRTASPQEPVGAWPGPGSPAPPPAGESTASARSGGCWLAASEKRYFRARKRGRIFHRHGPGAGLPRKPSSSPCSHRTEARRASGPQARRDPPPAPPGPGAPPTFHRPPHPEGAARPGGTAPSTLDGFHPPGRPHTASTAPPLRAYPGPGPFPPGPGGAGGFTAKHESVGALPGRSPP